MRIGNLRPEWISPPGRFAVGLSFDCHVCLADPHRVFLFFRHPLDGFPQFDGDGTTPVYTVDVKTGGLAGLTLLEPIILDCWMGVMVDGELLWH